MKLTEVTATEKIEKAGRKAGPNPFLNDETIKTFTTPIAKGELKGQFPTFRINLDGDDKPHSIVNQMRKAAESVNFRVSVALDSGTAKLTDAKTFRVMWTPKKDKAPA